MSTDFQNPRALARGAVNAKLIRKFIERMSPMHADGSWQIPEMALAAAVIEQGYTDLRDAFGVA